MNTKTSHLSYSHQKYANIVSGYLEAKMKSGILSYFAERIQNRDTIKALYEKMMYLIGLETGCRVSEIIAIWWEHIDLDHGIIFIFDKKKSTAKKNKLIRKNKPVINWEVWRRNYISAELIELIEKVKKLMKIDQRKQNIRKHKYAFPFTERTANRRFKAWCHGAGLTYIKRYSKDGKRDIGEFRWHNLRATWVTDAIKAGTPDKQIMNQTGNSRKTLDEYYSKFTDDDGREMAENIADYRGST